jgi:hypothetical protein
MVQALEIESDRVVMKSRLLGSEAENQASGDFS